jgi:protein-S-isoprenylcysteine O-methyltransferase Ste14
MNALQRKAVLQTTGFLVLLGILLFVPAGTLDYWEGSVYYVVMCVLVVAVGAYFLRHDPRLVERRLRLSERGEPERSQRVIQTLSGTAFFAMFLVAGLDHRFHWSALPASLVVVADVLVVVGFLIVFRVFQENRYASSTVEVEAGQTVVSTGPYAVVRHPMYAAALPLVLATPIALGSWWALPCAVIIAGLIVVRLLDEERVLARDLPGYREYCQKTRYRLLPGIW